MSVLLFDNKSWRTSLTAQWFKRKKYRETVHNLARYSSDLGYIGPNCLCSKASENLCQEQNEAGKIGWKAVYFFPAKRQLLKKWIQMLSPRYSQAKTRWACSRPSVCGVLGRAPGEKKMRGSLADSYHQLRAWNRLKRGRRSLHPAKQVRYNPYPPLDINARNNRHEMKKEKTFSF